ncbi:DNA methylase [Methylocapsa palsarum]|uniref:site-specific DNA-methyltransferase (adenine-specific) n=2 Tax=Methylocapsa palsarum TaxID=1612308 RepID=A0A1I3YF43_9HYPH|nr:DNA methylase [Methylocapsa palsarum]
MITDAIKDVSRRGAIVLDLFGGSGSTLIAAHKTGRRARLCELDPIYCDRILSRWENFAKDEAELVVCRRIRQAWNGVALDDDGAPLDPSVGPSATQSDGDTEAGSPGAEANGLAHDHRRLKRARSQGRPATAAPLRALSPSQG